MIKKNLIFDVGMHKGEDTLYYLKKGFDVVAFEADPSHTEFCKKELESFISTGQLVIVEGAIVPAGTNGPVKFYKNPNNSVLGTVVGEWADRNDFFGNDSVEISVDAVSFGDCLRKYGIPYYLKIDIEGMDLVCCKELESFEDKPCYLSIESELNSIEELKNEFKILARLGYSDFQLVQQLDVYKQREPLTLGEKNNIGFKFSKGSSGLFGKDLLESKWTSEDNAVTQYERVFKRYKRFGNNSFFQRKIPLFRYFISIIYRLTGCAIHGGWHDTHARHSSVK